MAKVTGFQPYHNDHGYGDPSEDEYGCDHCGLEAPDGSGVYASSYPAEVLTLLGRFFPDVATTQAEIEDCVLDDGRYCSLECLLCDLLPAGFEYVNGEASEVQ
jgi:hypothetical protein